MKQLKKRKNLFTIIDGAANAVAVQVARTAAAVIPVMKSFFIKNILS